MKPIIFKSTCRAISRILVVAIFSSMLVGVAMPMQSVNASQSAVGSVCFGNPSTASYIDLDHANNAVGTSDFTLEMWVKTPNIISSAQALVNGHSAATGVSTLSLFLDGNPGQSNGTIGFSHPAVNVKPGIVPANAWFHYAYVRTGTTGKVYVNGIPRTNRGGTDLESVTDSVNFTATRFRIGYQIAHTLGS